jgi:hypothetical protein
VIGYTPAEVGAMSMWQFMACIEGYRAAHGGEKPGLSDAEAREIEDMLDRIGG